MRTLELNFNNALEILTHGKNQRIYDYVKTSVEELPHFQFKGKSETKSKGKASEIDTCQEHINRYLEYKFNVFEDWILHPTLHEELKLKADFRKEHNNKQFQIEVQCGNNSRYYADIVKFQIAWLYELSHVAILIVPTAKYAERIGENICNYERIDREQNHLRKITQLPILIIGFEPDKNTLEFDLLKTSYSFLTDSSLNLKDKYKLIKSRNHIDRNIQSLLIHKIGVGAINEFTEVDRSMIPKEGE